MTAFENLLKKYATVEYGELVATARDAYENLMPVLEQFDPENNGFAVLVALITATFSADGELSKGEREFIKAVFELDDAHVDKLSKSYTGDGTEEALLDSITDLLSVREKSYAVNLIACIAASDKEVKHGELKYIFKLVTE